MLGPATAIANSTGRLDDHVPNSTLFATCSKVRYSSPRATCSGAFTGGVDPVRVYLATSGYFHGFKAWHPHKQVVRKSLYVRQPSQPSQAKPTPNIQIHCKYMKVFVKCLGVRFRRFSHKSTCAEGTDLRATLPTTMQQVMRSTSASEISKLIVFCCHFVHTQEHHGKITLYPYSLGISHCR